MSKKIVVLSTSPRRGGNSESLADVFRDICLLAKATDGDARAMDGAAKGLESWAACFDQAKLSGALRGVGVDNIGAVQTHSALLEHAAQMGRRV